MYLDRVRVRDIVSGHNAGFNDFLPSKSQGAVSDGLVLETALVRVPHATIAQSHRSSSIVGFHQEGGRVDNYIFFITDRRIANETRNLATGYVQ